MEHFEDYSLYAEDFKCFGPKMQGFQQVRRMNLIIGRNNTGKSAMLDLVRFAVEPKDIPPHYSHKHKRAPSVLMSKTLDMEMIKQFFSRDISGRDIPGRNLFEYGLSLVGSKFYVELPNLMKGGYKFRLNNDYVPKAFGPLESAARSLRNPLEEFRFAQIAAERNIVAESDAGEVGLKSDGAGAVNIIQRFINDDWRPSDLIKEILLNDLNRIMKPDAKFTRIAIQRSVTDDWMVHLDEHEKGRISLADSGSGLKTILLVLINMLVLPKLNKEMEKSKFVFAFEELENNLHPGLQRRLLKYVHKKLTEIGAIAFVTTHSPAIIDMFGRKDDAQILHVVHDGKDAKVYEVAQSADGHKVLDDLEVKASDLLQANGIVWVEGISDVIYLRRWIELYCQDNGLEVPVEGSEFAFMEYGGRCLKHLDFSATSAEDLPAEDANWLLPALTVSRNNYVVMDSDKRNEDSEVNETKRKAAEKACGSWITEGREVENYLPPDVAEEMFGKSLDKYDSASHVHEECKRSRLEKKKAATAATKMLNSGNWHHLNLDVEIGKLVQAISEWNPVFDEEGLT